MAFLNFLGSQPGRNRAHRSRPGLHCIGVLAGGGWLALVVAGMLPLAAGVFDFCVLGPLFRLSFVGPKFREATVSR